MRAAHPYEEVAFDLYQVMQGPASQGLIRGLGYGFWGEYKSSKPFPDVARSVRNIFGTQGFWLTDPTPTRIKRVAFVAGKGASFVEAASALGCDLFITGEAGYHTALAGARLGVSVMELGHRESEIFYISTMESWLSKMGLKTVGLNIQTQRVM